MLSARKTHFLVMKEIENFIQRTFYFLFFITNDRNLNQADNNLTISNFEEVLAASCELKDIRFQMMARRSNSYCYCFSSMCKCIKLSSMSLRHILSFKSIQIITFYPFENTLAYIYGKEKNNKFPKPFCKQWSK